MDVILNLGLDTLTYGMAYAILALGVFISYRVLNFADMTTEGTFVLGSASVIWFIAIGIPAWIATIMAILIGAIAGFVTGILHTKLHVNGLLSGIITMTGLFTINMVIMGIAQSAMKGTAFNFFETYRATVSLESNRYTVIFDFARNNYSTLAAFGATRKYWVIGIMALITLGVYTLIYFFFGTEVGMSMRATGMNQKMARAQGINTDFYIILGLMISNGLIALASCLIAQRDYTTSSQNGTGMLVVGLAAIIIGEAIFGKRSFKNWIISVALGALIYYLIIAIATALGMPTHFLKLLYAVIIIIILALSFVNSTTHFVEKIKYKFRNKNKYQDEILQAEAHEDIKESTTPLVVEDKVMLEVSNLTKIFNPTGNPNDVKVALDHINLKIKKGEFVTIIGGNGSGKSTFFNTVSGTYIPDDGYIQINGHDVTKYKEYKKAIYIGRVAQDPYQGTAPDMSILENMNIAKRRPRRRKLLWGFRKKDTEKYKDMVADLGLGLENRLTSKIGLLSGGQRQSITLLMATLEKPEILFLDEHTAALDPKTARKVLTLTDKIVRENHLTTVMVTHNMRDAIKYGNRLIMFNNGHIIYDVSGDEKQKLTVEDLLQKFEDVDFSDKDVLVAKETEREDIKEEAVNNLEDASNTEASENE